MTENIIAIDIGTTNIKALAFGLNGILLASHTEKMVTHHPAHNYSEYDADEIWESLCRCLLSVTQQAGKENIKAVGVTSLGESGVLIDRKGQALYPVIAWFDERTRQQADWWRETMGNEKIFSITGQYLHGKYGLNKLMWIKESFAESYSQGYKLAVHGRLHIIQAYR